MRNGLDPAQGKDGGKDGKTVCRGLEMLNLVSSFATVLKIEGCVHRRRRRGFFCLK